MPAPSLVNSTTPQTGSGNSMVVNLPASIVTGNLLVVVLGQGGTIGTPVGWSTKLSANNISIHWRWADGTEGSTVTFTTSGVNTITQAVAIQLSGSLGSGDPFDGATTSVTAAATASTALSLTTTVVDTLLLFVDAKNASRTANVAPSGFAIFTPNPAVTHGFQKNQATAASTGSLTSNYTSGSAHSTLLAAIKPNVLVVETRTGTAAVVLAASSVSREVEKSAAAAGVTVSASASSVVLFRKTGAASLTLTASAAARGVERRTGSASVALAATAAAIPVQRRTGAATIALTGTAAAVAAGGIKTRTGSAVLTLTGTATASTDATIVRTGAASIVPSGTAVARIILTRTGAATLGLNATATSSASGGIHPRTGVGYVSLGASATTRTVHPRTGRAELGINQTNTVRVVVIERRTGVASVTLSGAADATVVEWRTAQATVVLGSRGNTDAHRDITVLSVTEIKRVVTFGYDPNPTAYGDGAYGDGAYGSIPGPRTVTITPIVRPVRIEYRP